LGKKKKKTSPYLGTFSTGAKQCIHLFQDDLMGNLIDTFGIIWMDSISMLQLNNTGDADLLLIFADTLQLHPVDGLVS